MNPSPSISLPRGDARTAFRHTVMVCLDHKSSVLDVSTIAAVLHHANQVLGTPFYLVSLVSSGTHARTVEGIRLATIAVSSLPAEPASTLVLTHSPSRSCGQDPVTDWLVRHLRSINRWCAIDEGVLSLAELGVLGGRRVAVGPVTRARLADWHPGATVDECPLFARDGKLWSCPGGAPVSDLALALVEQDLGRRVANDVARRLLMPGRRSANQPQLSPIMQVQSAGGRDQVLAQLVDWINQNLETQLDVPKLASRVSMSERNFHRRFKAFTSLTPAAYINQVRADHARQLLLADVTLKEIAVKSELAFPHGCNNTNT
jgi:transcriptional regulator GlxA family with amidase domain